ncbi:PROTEIN PHOSPHATASE 2C [Salix purpurea]|uniref:PROTEIN PHOSPHATASE 2C n=1 Tax=Salix purpurea TaxID=77065 RepID=A0A9Q0TUA8_SALPP|nr:PROTEIN PHOSPHATASE 2C [Salix purpurea]
MSCSIAPTIPNSPIFQSPRHPSIFCKPCPSPSIIHGPQSPASSSSLPLPPSLLSSFSSSLPKSPLALRVNNETRSETITDTLLKRKRPGKLNIPVAGVSGFSLEIPKGEKERVEVVEFEGDGYSVYCKRGRRGGIMEDRYSASVDVNGGSKQASFGVFDGHGGPKAADFAAENLNKNIMDQVSGNLVVSNTGDCRAVMSRKGVAEALTSDHQPSRKDEKDRIEALGGYVDCCHSVWRIQGCLAVTRGIGDRRLKRWVIAEPETKVLKIKPECEFLILASDGLWNKVTNQEAVDVAHPMCTGVDKPDPFSACKKLAELSLERGSVDDTSVMIIQLDRFAP